MSFMPPRFPSAVRPCDRGFTAVSPVGAARRACLGGGLVLVLLLVAFSLVSAYVAPVPSEPGWVEGTGPVPIAAGR